MKDLWKKVKKVAKELPGLTKVIATRILNEHKEEIMEELTKMKQVLIDAGKKVLIVVKKGVVQLVIGETMGYSNDHALVEKRGFRDFWEKVKAAVAKSNANIRDFFKSNWDKVGFEEVTDVGVGFGNSGLDFLPEITESTFLNKGVVVGVSHHFSDDELNNSLLDDDENFLSGIDQDLFHLGEFFHDLFFVLVQDTGSNHLGESGQFLGHFLHFFPQIFHVIHDSVSILLRFSNLSPSDDGDDLITDGDHDFLVRVQDHLLHGVQSFDDLGLVLGDQSLHLFFGDSNKVISSSLYFLPDFVQISNDLNTLLGHLHPDFLGSFNNDLLEFVQVSLSFGQSSGDLGFQSLIFVLEEVTDLGVGALDCLLEFPPGVFNSTFLHVGEFIVRLDRVVSNNDLSNIVDDTDEDGLSGLDESFLHLVQLFHDEGFVLVDDVDDNFLHFSAQVLGGFLDFFPCSLQFVLDSVSLRPRYSAGDSSDDTGDLVFDFDVDLGGSINDDLFGVVQLLDDNWFEFLNLSLNVVFQVSLEFVDSVLDFFHNIIGIFDDLDSEFVNADMDFLGLVNDEVFVVFNIFLEFVQSFNDLWFVFLDLSLDEFISLNLSVLKSSLNLGPDSLQVSDDFDSLSLCTDEQSLGSLDHNFFESIHISLGLLQSSHDLGLQNFQFVLEEILHFSGGVLDGILDLLPEVGVDEIGAAVCGDV